VLSLLHAVSGASVRRFLPDLEADVRGEERISAAVTLARLEPARAPAVVALLVGVLNAWDTEARRRAALALGELGQAARAALPALRRRRDLDDDHLVRAAAGEAAGTIERALR
jgi:hypothetical protein